jgi:hypothetical protein
MKTTAARFISIAGHPFVLLALLLFLPRFQSSTNGALRTTLTFAIIVFVPLTILIWRSYASGEWRTVDASDKADRPLFYRVSIALVLGATAWFWLVERSPALARGSLAAAAMLLLAATLNRWIKISLHLAFACFSGILLARVRLSYGLPVLLLVPPLIWSRIVLSRHVFSETVGGVVLGVLGALGFMWL